MSFNSITPQSQSQINIGTKGYVTGTFVDTGDTYVIRFHNDAYGKFDVSATLEANNTQLGYFTIPLYVTKMKNIWSIILRCYFLAPEHM